mmetsp:Transcript_7116/g.21720  ORF Transcript_7116/g.21720 Transcript_7116/m.21720 type:complete len:310 (+) Transcript_7116:677-1606(+)
MVRATGGIDRARPACDMCISGTGDPSLADETGDEPERERNFHSAQRVPPDQLDLSSPCGHAPRSHRCTAAGENLHHCGCGPELSAAAVHDSLATDRGTGPVGHHEAVWWHHTTTHADQQVVHVPKGHGHSDERAAGGVLPGRFPGASGHGRSRQPVWLAAVFDYDGCRVWRCLHTTDVALSTRKRRIRGCQRRAQVVGFRRPRDTSRDGTCCQQGRETAALHCNLHRSHIDRRELLHVIAHNSRPPDDIPDGGVQFPTGAGVYLCINPKSCRLWHQSDGRNTLGASRQGHSHASLWCSVRAGIDHSCIY